MNMTYVVKMPKHLDKVIREMPKNTRIMLAKLIDDITNTGPVQPSYHNYSKLGKDRYHCHLGYKWVAVWRYEQGTYIVEVEYVGSREKAPY